MVEILTGIMGLAFNRCDGGRKEGQRLREIFILYLR